MTIISISNNITCLNKQEVLHIVNLPFIFFFFMQGLKHGRLFMFSFSLHRQWAAHWPIMPRALHLPIPLSLPLCDWFSQRETVSRQFCACRFHSASVFLLYCFLFPIILFTHQCGNRSSTAEAGVWHHHFLYFIFLFFLRFHFLFISCIWWALVVQARLDTHLLFNTLDAIYAFGVGILIIFE